MKSLNKLFKELCDLSFTGQEENYFSIEHNKTLSRQVAFTYDYMGMAKMQSVEKQYSQWNNTQYDVFFNNNDSSLGKIQLSEIKHSDMQTFNIVDYNIPSLMVRNQHVLYCFNNLFGKKIWFTTDENQKYELYSNAKESYGIKIDLKGNKNKLKNGLNTDFEWFTNVVYFQDRENYGIGIDVQAIEPNEYYSERNCEEPKFYHFKINGFLMINGECIYLDEKQLRQVMKQLYHSNARKIVEIYASLHKRINKMTKEDKNNLKYFPCIKKHYLAPIVSNNHGVIRLKYLLPPKNCEKNIIGTIKNDIDARVYLETLYTRNKSVNKCEEDTDLQKIVIDDYTFFLNTKKHLFAGFKKTQYGDLDLGKYDQISISNAKEMLKKKMSIVARLQNLSLEDVYQE